MKFFKKIKEFFVNISSGDYDHATRSMNEFLATGKFPDRCDLKKPEKVEAEVVTVSDRVVDTNIDELTKKKQEAIDIIAKEKNIKVKVD